MEKRAGSFLDDTGGRYNALEMITGFSSYTNPYYKWRRRAA